MTVSNTWKKDYQRLDEFINAHPEIVITQNEVSIPQTVRGEFYRRFDDIRKAVVEDRYATLPVEIGMLSENYIRMEKEIKEILGLEEISMPVDLFIFLHNPKEGLVRSIYNRMFDLLQGKIVFDDFEPLATEDISLSAAGLYRLGYERWATLALIKLLDPDEVFRIDLDDEDKPVLAELKTICFGRQAHHATMRIPEFVIHSRKLGMYVTFKMALVREIDTYVVPVKPRVRPRNRTGDTSRVLDSRTVLLSFLSDPKDIPVVAEIYECTRTSPDWLIQFVAAEDLTYPPSLELVLKNREAMNPRQGMGLFLVEPGSEPAREMVPENMYAAAIGFDQSKLQSYIDTYFCAEGSAETLTT